jgi:hypothetical protein
VVFRVAQQLVACGYVGTCNHTETVRKTTRSTFVEVAAVKRFTDEFASSQELAVRFGTHDRVLVPELTGRGIMPAIRRDLVGQHFYR